MKKVLKTVFTIVISLVFAVTILSACADSAPSGEQQPGEQQQYTLAYSASFLSHEFYQRALQGMELEAASWGVELLVADSNNDVSSQVAHMETFISQKVDALIVSAVDPNAIVGLVERAVAEGIIVVSDGQPIGGGESTVVGNDWHHNGQMLGEWLVEEVKARGIDANILIVGLPTLPIIADLERGFTEVVEKGGIASKIISVDGDGMMEQSLVRATDALTANPDINVIFGINDDSALGAIQAAKMLDMDLSNMITITHGLEGNGGCIAMAEEGTLTVAAALFPEIYGAYNVRASMEALGGKVLPEIYMSPVAIVTIENMSQFYTKQGDNYVLNFEAALALLG